MVSKHARRWLTLGAVSVGVLSLSGCPGKAPRDTMPTPGKCIRVEGGYGNPGTAQVELEQVAAQLEVPWAIAWLPDGDLLVTERPGRVRRIRGSTVFVDPVAVVDTTADGESGLLGIALSPDFSSNRRMYLYVTVGEGDARRNEVQRWVLTPDYSTAAFEKVILGDIPAANYHDGGRLRFGQDGMLYVGTGDASTPDLAQNEDSLGGKLLRITEEGAPAPGNPVEGKAMFVSGIRNTQGFDFFPHDRSLLAITDHGPSGEFGRQGEDEVSVARAGDNLGWPKIAACESEDKRVTPSMVWQEALPPAGAAFVTSDVIPEWKNSLLVATLKSQHLHRIVFDAADPRVITSHEMYFEGEFGRLREAVQGPDGHLYITTSNCDGRGTCPADKDKILRVIRKN